MPELPEVETTCQSLRQHLVGKKIKETIVYQAKLRWLVPIEFAIETKDVIIQSITRRAKYILLATSKGTAIIHLGMSGKFYLAPFQSERKKHDHIQLLLEDETVVRYHDPRRFGSVAWTTQDPLLYPTLASLGQEPLEPEFNGAYLFSKMQKKQLPIKQCLMDNAIVVGVGNIYANESLFKAKIHPQRKGTSLSLKECQSIVCAIKSVLKKSIAKGGTTLKDFLSPEGKKGYFAQELAIYGRYNEKCFICNTAVQTIKLGQRSTFFCSQCQY